MKYVFLLIVMSLLSSVGFAQVNRVLLIGIDGCRPDALVAADTPYLDALMANGTYSLDALNTGITSSGPGWSTLMTGVWPAKHGVTDNSFAGEDFLNYPHLFQRIEEYDASMQTASIVQWHPINNSIADGIADLTINVDDHTDFVESAAVNYLSTADPDALFIHFDDVDHAGHGYGFSPATPEYITAIETVDAGIGGVLDALYARPSYAEENWVIIVSTDHGGINTNHGGNSIEERKIFMIVSGEGIAYEEIIADSTLTTIPPIFDCLGDSTALYFDGNASGESTESQLFDFGANQDFTVECRVRTTQSGDVAIMTDKDWDSGLNPGWVFSFNVSGGPWKVNVGDGSNRVDIEGNAISDGEWHTLSATFDRDGMLTLYEDGAFVNEISMAELDTITAGNRIVFGADLNQDYRYTGHIAEARIFAELVSPDAIADWSCMRLSVEHPSYPYLVSQWALNEGLGTSLGNDGANALATTIEGAIWESSLDTSYVWEKDYSNTPRQVDYMVSALEHLCVPIQEVWNLDGEILATYCQEEPSGLTEDVQSTLVRYDPITDMLSIECLTATEIKLYDTAGRLVIEEHTSAGITQVSLAGMSDGVYLFQARDGASSLSGKITK